MHLVQFLVQFNCTFEGKLYCPLEYRVLLLPQQHNHLCTCLLSVFSWIDKTESKFTDIITSFPPAHHLFLLVSFVGVSQGFTVHECHQGRYLGSPHCITSYEHPFFFFSAEVWHASFSVTLVVACVPLGLSRVQGSMVAEVRPAPFFPLQARLPFKPSIDL